MMKEEKHFCRGEDIILDYTLRTPDQIWGHTFTFANAICATLRRDVSLSELKSAFDRGPWGWGGFTTEWIESIAERVALHCDGHGEILFEFVLDPEKDEAIKIKAFLPRVEPAPELSIVL